MFWFGLKLQKRIISLFLCSILSQNAFAQDGVIIAPKPIVQNELKEVKLWGVYEELPNETNLETDIWLNSNTHNLNFAFDKISQNNNFTPIQSLARRAVFSGGIAPNNDEILSKNRFLAAAKLGSVKSSSNILSFLPNIIDEENLAILYADNLFYQSKNDAACEIISNLKPSKTNRKLLEMRAACYALNNEADAARLSLDVANSLDTKASDEWLNRAIYYVSSINADNAPSIAQGFEFNGKNSVSFALSKASKADLNNAKEMSLSALQLLISNNEKLNENMAILALRNGLLTYENAKTYLPMPIAIAKTDEIQIAPDISDELMFYIKKARNITEFANIAKTIAPKLLEAKNFNIDNIAYFAAAALINGNYQEASRFLNMDFAQKPALSLLLSILDENPKEFALTRRIDAEKINSPEYMNAMGDAIIAKEVLKTNEYPNGILGIVWGAKSSINSQTLYAIENAAQNNAKGEVILLSAIALQNENPKNSDVFGLAKILNSLNKIGYQKEAKELAIYAIIARNLEFFAPKPEVKPIPKPPVSKAPVSKTNQIKPETKPAQKPPSNPVPDWKPNAN